MDTKKKTNRRKLLVQTAIFVVPIALVAIAKMVMMDSMQSSLRNEVMSTIVDEKQASLETPVSDNLEEKIYSLVEIYQWIMVVEASGGDMSSEKAILEKGLTAIADELYGAGNFEISAVESEIQNQLTFLANALVTEGVLEDLLPDYTARFANLVQAGQNDNWSSYQIPTQTQISEMKAYFVQQSGPDFARMYQNQIKEWLRNS